MRKRLPDAHFMQTLAYGNCKIFTKKVAVTGTATFFAQ